MKTERRKIKANIVDFEFDMNKNLSVNFSINEHDFNTETLEVTAEVKLPESLKEFREINNLTKEQLLNWLNENYNKESNFYTPIPVIIPNEIYDIIK